ncbi:DUF4238 domain-containing protein [Methylobacterium sp. Leaf93]|uniref:DUF4238 domain-containing protein n=1 Tax=Methylobacterium sp. Leaf93 TaxID=1736249 RepID=UPI0009E9C66C|nr:DUF4238 domain-containing protein [Methylobacterium sp. Leaf93]
MSAKRRNHFLPRFLLNRFASKADPKKNKFKIWVIPKLGEPRELSTKDVAVKKKMYGLDPDLEDRLSEKEGDWAHIFREIANGQNPNDFSADLSNLIWLQAWRTRSIRMRFEDLILNLLTEMRDQIYKINFIEKIYPHLAYRFWQKLSTLNNKELLFAYENCRVFGIYTTVELAVTAYISGGAFQEELYKSVHRMIDPEVMNDAIKESFNKTLLEAASYRESASAWNIPNWEVWDFPELDLVLGDCGIICSKSGGDLGPVKDATNWDHIILPIDPGRCIVGNRNSYLKRMTSSDLNSAISKSSINEIFSSRINQENLMLRDNINTNSAILNEEEMSSLLKNLWDLN